MFAIGESRPISQVNETERQTQNGGFNKKKSSSGKIYHRNSSIARMATRNPAHAVKKKVTARNRRAATTSLSPA